MSGREKFNKYKKVINMISKYTPTFLLKFAWYLTQSTENHFALLVRYSYLNKKAKKCGNNVFIGKYVTLKNISNLSLGDNISIHAYSYIDSFGDITINSNVSIANHTSIISFEHSWENKKKPIKYNKVIPGKIKIEEDVWIGSGCRVLSNTIIHKRSILAAGCVINKNVPSNVIIGGVPGKVIKKI